jgi:hypothetical protein
MNILRKFSGFIPNFKSARSLLSSLLVRVAIGIFDRKDRRILCDLS